MRVHACMASRSSHTRPLSMSNSNFVVSVLSSTLQFGFWCTTHTLIYSSGKRNLGCRTWKANITKMQLIFSPVQYNFPSSVMILFFQLFFILLYSSPQVSQHTLTFHLPWSVGRFPASFSPLSCSSMLCSGFQTMSARKVRSQAPQV